MSLETLTKRAQEQTARWKGLDERATAIQKRIVGLQARRQEIVIRFQASRASLQARITALMARMPEQVGRVQQMVASLRSVAEALNTSVAETGELTVDAFTRVEESAAEAAAILGTQTEQAIQETIEAAQTQFQDLKQFIEKDYLETLAGDFEEKVGTVCESCEELRDAVEEHVDQWIEHADEQVEELVEQLGDFGGQWKESFDSIEECYTDLVERVVALGKDVTTLTESIDVALDTTGIGMNAATKTMDDIRAVMAGIV